MIRGMVILEVEDVGAAEACPSTNPTMEVGVRGHTMVVKCNGIPSNLVNTLLLLLSQCLIRGTVRCSLCHSHKT